MSLLFFFLLLFAFSRGGKRLLLIPGPRLDEKLPICTWRWILSVARGVSRDAISLLDPWTGLLPLSHAPLLGLSDVYLMYLLLFLSTIVSMVSKKATEQDWGFNLRGLSSALDLGMAMQQQLVARPA